MRRVPSRSAAVSGRVRSSKKKPRITQAIISRAMPSMTLNASVRNLTDSDSLRMKNARMTIAMAVSRVTSDLVITLTRRALAIAISSRVKPITPSTRNMVARKPCLVNGKNSSSSTPVHRVARIHDRGDRDRTGDPGTAGDEEPDDLRRQPDRAAIVLGLEAPCAESVQTDDRPDGDDGGAERVGRHAVGRCGARRCRRSRTADRRR